MSKGSKQRPTDTAKYSANWDRIFNKDKADLNFESDNPLERPYEPPRNLEDVSFWRHKCKADLDCVYFVEVGYPCSWCGKFEDGSKD